MLQAVAAVMVAVVVALSAAQPAEGRSLARERVRAESLKHVGVPYVWGGASPRGFDCSGLVQYVYRRAGIRLPRTADVQARYGTPILLGAARSGDLLYFNTGARRGEITHVGIYMGDGRMLHAPRSGKRVQVVSVGPGSWFGARLLAVRQIDRRSFRLDAPPRFELPALASGGWRIEPEAAAAFPMLASAGLGWVF